MNKKLKLTIILFLITLFASTSFMLPVSAQLPIPENFVHTEVDGGAVKKSIKKQQLCSLLQTTSVRGRSSNEIGFAILSALGYPEDKIGSISMEEIAEADTVAYITQYIKVPNEGEPEFLSKENCIADMTREKFEAGFHTASARIPGNSSGSAGDVTSNGYMQFGFLYLFTSSTRLYTFLGTAEWLKMPACRSKDAVSVSATDVAWLNKSYDNYCAEVDMSYKMYDKIAGKTSYSSDGWEMGYNSAVSQPEGFYYSFRLPGDTATESYQKVYTGGYVTVNGKAQLKNTNIDTFNVYMKYAHRKLNLTGNLSFGWSSGNNPGVSFSGGLGWEKDYYGLRIKVD